MGAEIGATTSYSHMITECMIILTTEREEIARTCEQN